MNARRTNARNLGSEGMMRLLVISDTHGYLDFFRKAVSLEGPWDQIVHLGDSVLDAVELAVELGVDVAALRGNNEYSGAGAEADEELVFEAGGVRFYAEHGHAQDLNPYAGDERLELGLRELCARARERGAAVCLFGHTHQPLVRREGDLLLVNPGGAGLGDKRRSYAEIIVNNGEARAEIKYEAA